MSDKTNQAVDITNETRRAAKDIMGAAFAVSEEIAQPMQEAVEQSDDQAKGANQSVVEVAKEQFNRVSREAAAGYRSALASGQKLQETAQSSIKRMPITAVIIATGVGALLGYVLSRVNRHPASCDGAE